jgi:hypothetical protein
MVDKRHVHVRLHSPIPHEFPQFAMSCEFDAAFVRVALIGAQVSDLLPSHRVRKGTLLDSRHSSAWVLALTSPAITLVRPLSTFQYRPERPIR